MNASNRIKIFFVPLIFVFTLLCIAAGLDVSKKKIKNRFFGVWELIAIENNGKEVPALPGQLKLFGPDNSYRFLVSGATGTFFTQEGTFKILSDIIYSEDIEFSTNQNLRGVSSKVSYTFIDEDVMKVNGSVNNVPFQEKWRRVKIFVR
ncbi:DUF4488 domain-containing protein [Sphingobacterium pedocola]|uniref:DUF4488 domain-containing protein n=1 Tax=Sphingobacterium pedocola TaxID=2082722 RepID=A0ABR9TB06_9SPHI|nr:DUF4488 domain-containing protein [Sphingobacterium pedocola]MBE8722217.1 hypothetical protein [Sphingobacterium pedocola]